MVNKPKVKFVGSTPIGIGNHDSLANVCKQKIAESKSDEEAQEWREWLQWVIDDKLKTSKV